MKVKKLILLISVVVAFSCKNSSVHPVQGEIIEAVYGLGTVESAEKFLAKSAITNSVLEFYVSEGEDVIRGQKLFKTDQGAVITSPIVGRVADIPISIKENVFPQTTIMTVINLQKIFLTVSLEQQAIMRIKSGLKTEVSFEFFRNKKLLGKVSTIYPVGDQFIAKVELDKWPEGVLPGMTADVAIEVDRKKSVTLIPMKAIANGNILIKRNGKKIKTPVSIGLIDLEKAEILSPVLYSSDEIIIP